MLNNNNNNTAVCLSCNNNRPACLSIFYGTQTWWFGYMVIWFGDGYCVGNTSTRDLGPSLTSAEAASINARSLHSLCITIIIIGLPVCLFSMAPNWSILLPMYLLVSPSLHQAITNCQKDPFQAQSSTATIDLTSDLISGFHWWHRLTAYSSPSLYKPEH